MARLLAPEHLRLLCGQGRNVSLCKRGDFRECLRRAFCWIEVEFHQRWRVDTRHQPQAGVQGGQPGSHGCQAIGPQWRQRLGLLPASLKRLRQLASVLWGWGDAHWQKQRPRQFPRLPLHCVGASLERGLFAGLSADVANQCFPQDECDLAGAGGKHRGSARATQFCTHYPHQCDCDWSENALEQATALGCGLHSGLQQLPE